VGHERPITTVRFNVEGDLLFTASVDGVVTLWNGETGERLGKYRGHKGAVHTLDVSRDSRYLLTASADSSVKLWEVTTGQCLATVQLTGPCHGVAWAEGEREFAVICNKFTDKHAALSVFAFNPDAPAELNGAVARWTMVFRDDLEDWEPSDPKCVVWKPLNDGVLVGFDNGVLVDVAETTDGPLEMWRWEEHSERITSISFNDVKTLMLTSSKDKSVCLWDVKSMTADAPTADEPDPRPAGPIKRFTTDVPVNAARLSPLREHLILGGGQEARDVTTTSGAAGKFETRFFDLVMAKELGRVKGHFGPIHSLDFSPDGWRFASGSETGNVILCKLDADYLLLGEEDNLDDPALRQALEDGTYEKLKEEEEEEKAQSAGRGAASGGGGGGGGGGGA
jgi:translation initiation factor 3 subunit I